MNATTTAPLALELQDITVTVPDGTETLTILDHASLAVARGEVVAVVGASGSGKSTLLAVAGLLRTPTSGAVAVDGQDVASLSERARTRAARRGDRARVPAGEPLPVAHGARAARAGGAHRRHPAVGGT